MSRAWKLLVIVLFATAVVGCGDKAGDDGSSEVSSNSGGGSEGSDEDFYGSSDSSGDGSGSSDDGEDFYNDGSGSSSDGEDFYKDGSGSSSDGEDFYKDGSGSSSDGEDFYKDGSGSSRDGEDFYKDGSGSSSDGEDFYKDGSGSSRDGEDFYKDGSGSSSDGEDFYKDGSGSSGDGEDFYKDGSGSGSGEDFYNSSSGESKPARPAPKNYTEHAQVAFENGHDELALKYTYAAILTDAEAAKNQTLHYWVGPQTWKGMPEPTMALRWGVGVNYVAAKILKSRPPMIGDKPNLSAGGTQGTNRPRVIGRRSEGSGASGYSGDSSSYDSGTDSYGGDGSGGGSFQLPDDAWGQLVYLTGELGERFVDRLEMRRVRDYYGAVLKKAPKAERTSSAGDFASGGSDYSGSGGSADYGSDSGSGGAADYGAEDYSSDSSGESRGGTANLERGPQLIPGATMLGMGNPKELLERAKAKNLDVLLVFDVNYKISRSRIESNDTSMSLYAVAEEKEVRKGSTLNNIAVWKAREDLKDEKNDPVELAIDHVLRDFADEQVKVAELPKLTPEQAKFRVGSITEKPPANPLRVLAEIKYFHTQGLLTDAELAEAYKRAIGDAGLQLATGSLEEQKKILAPYLEAATAKAETNVVPSGTDGGGFR